jgi:hypothetical protein
MVFDIFLIISREAIQGFGSGNINSKNVLVETIPPVGNITTR